MELMLLPDAILEPATSVLGEAAERVEACVAEPDLPEV
jgi:hypothetical protein